MGGGGCLATMALLIHVGHAARLSVAGQRAEVEWGDTGLAERGARLSVSVCPKAGAGMTASDVVRLLTGGEFDELERRFTAEMRAVVSAETVRVAWTVQTGGVPGEPGEPVGEPFTGDLTRWRVPVRHPAGDFVVVMSLDAGGRLHGLRLAADAGPAWQPPRYVRPERFTERAVGAHGALVTPSGRRVSTAAVVLPGGGEQDRDGTHGPDKPLKDLAWGLASRGIAVFRFDKPGPDRTLVEEYVTPAAQAVGEIRAAVPSVERIFLIGHSLGGKVAPRVAAAVPEIAGLVLLAAEAIPLQRSAERVTRHLAARDPGPAADAMLAAMQRQVALVDDGLTAQTPAADLPFGFPASYWLDLRGYDPVATAVALRRPMLILQGGRDHQVTVADDLARWRAGLGGRRDVRFRVLRRADHMFHSGSGRGPRHVDASVIRGIHRWSRLALG
ncbi:hypothetical protein ACWT_5268 [Actinoplanes sp. SE50]|nr:hypothetical protein ACPL_5399 [Actinoplanes sp. SE50/110]ATO84683.1 hypothetical protein ACWT_5268 [Actinoplanes sp. SE50]SLM02093.1 Esterase/lipase [Actinoplanes sp. SE50/110]